jgi:hypothetical protein
MRHYGTSILAAATLFAVGACGGTSTTGPAESTGPMSAVIDGTQWTADAQHIVVERTTGPGGTIISLAGANTNLNLGLAFPDSGAKTYQMGPPAFASNAILLQGAAAWVANPSGGNGTITVTALTNTRVAGTFQFSGSPVSGSGATATRQVTNGKFDLTF